MRTWRTKRYRYWSSHTIELHTAVATLPYVCCPTHWHTHIYSYHLYKPTFRLFIWLLWIIVVISGDFVQLSGCLYHFIPRPSGSPRLSFCEHWRHAAAAGAWLGLTPNMGIGSLGSCDTQFLGLNHQLPTISRLYVYVPILSIFGQFMKALPCLNPTPVDHAPSLTPNTKVGSRRKTFLC